MAANRDKTAEHIRVALKCVREDCVRQSRGAFAMQCFSVDDWSKIIRELQLALASAEGREL